MSRGHALALLVVAAGCGGNREPEPVAPGPPPGPVAPPPTTTSDGDGRAALAGVPVVSVSAAFFMLTMEAALPVALGDAGAGAGTITDAVYCGPRSSDAEARLLGLRCDSPACATAPREHVLTLADCDQPRTIPSREVVEIVGHGERRRITLTAMLDAGARRVALPAVEWSDIDVPMRTTDRELTAQLSPVGVRFRRGLLDFFFRVPPTTLTPPNPPVPSVDAYADVTVVDPAARDTMAGPRGFVTIPITTLNALIGDRIVRRFGGTPPGISILSRDLGGGLTAQSHLRELAFVPVSTHELRATATLANRLVAPGGLTVEAPAVLRVRFEQDDATLHLAGFELQDLRDYTCPAGDGICAAAAERVRAIVTGVYDSAAARAAAGGRTVQLVRPGQSWQLTFRYGAREWRQRFRVTHAALVGEGGTHLGVAVEAGLR